MLIYFGDNVLRNYILKYYEIRGYNQIFIYDNIFIKKPTQESMSNYIVIDYKDIDDLEFKKYIYAPPNNFFNLFLSSFSLFESIFDNENIDFDNRDIFNFKNNLKILKGICSLILKNSSKTFVGMYNNYNYKKNNILKNDINDLNKAIVGFKILFFNEVIPTDNNIYLINLEESTCNLEKDLEKFSYKFEKEISVYDQKITTIKNFFGI